MATEVPILSENSKVGWEIEATFKTAAAAAAYRPFGRLTEWSDLGPKISVFRDQVAGSGREAASIGFEGFSYDGTIGPYQVVDPLGLGFAWGQELSAPVIIGAGPYYRHTATPTTRGILPSRSVQMRDVQGGGAASPQTDKTTFLGTVTRRLSLRGEAPGEDGAGGRLLAAEDLMAHDHDDTVADKTVAAPTTDPYRFHHGLVTLFGEQVTRVEDFEFTLDNQAKYNYYWVDANQRKPYEAPPEGVLYDFRATLIADGELYTGSNYLAGQIAKNMVLSNGTLKFVRTSNQDEFQVNLTDIAATSLLKRRTLGGASKVKYLLEGHGRSTSLQWVDTTSTRFYPS